MKIWLKMVSVKLEFSEFQGCIHIAKYFADLM